MNLYVKEEKENTSNVMMIGLKSGEGGGGGKSQCISVTNAKWRAFAFSLIRNCVAVHIAQIDVHIDRNGMNGTPKSIPWPIVRPVMEIARKKNLVANNRSIGNRRRCS